MTSAHWIRIEELFHAALERAPEERARFLRRACHGDRELLDEVQRLLDAEETSAAGSSAADLLDAPAAEALRGWIDAARPHDALVGRCIGAFRLVRCIASGGMGTVYEAERTQGGFEQRAAVKLRRPELGTPELEERFRNERRTLARLGHPNIARLLDGGTTEDGLAYLVLEYVDGRPITRYCDEEGLSIPRRIELFRCVCQAVHHAHRNLIIHRDIKPSNVLVDGEGNVKLLDFGIAKVFERDAEGGPRTATGERFMTPEYASPEQIRGDALTTATDVYSLGVVLFELLTGSRPHGDARASPHRVERAVLEQDAEKPSTVVARCTRDPGSRAIFEQRSIRPERLRRLLAGDLDTIVLAALRKEPERRHASAEELAEDLRRFTRGLPVSARPDTWRYRTGRFLARHRLGVAGSLAVLAALLAGGVSVVWSALDARRRSAEILRLMSQADLTNLAAYEGEVERLWPASPEKVPGLESWLERARGFAASLEQYRATLEELRARAVPWDPESLAEHRARHPRAGELADLGVRREARLFWLARETPEHALYETELSEIETEIDALEAEIDAEAGLRFASEEERLQHETLARLVARLEEFVANQSGTIAQVEERLAFARTIRERSIEEHADEWRAAVASIADPRECPAYGGLALEPQLGLVPVGRDPDSGLWEFGHLQTGALVERGADGRLTIGAATGLVFVLLPGGRFAMGARRPRPGEAGDAANVDPAADPVEGPVHEVELAPFLLSKYEMTQGQWLRFTGANPSHFHPGEEHGAHVVDLRHPVEMVSWETCGRVLAQLGLAIPSEAQWEYAARGGTSTPWWTGSEPDSLVDAANFMDRAAEESGVPWPRSGGDFDDGHVIHAPVGSFAANPFGLHDVLGNLWEWTADDCANYELPARGPRGERMLKGSNTVVGRGGSFMDVPKTLRVSHRGSTAPTMHDRNIGVRPALDLRP